MQTLSRSHYLSTWLHRTIAVSSITKAACSNEQRILASWKKFIKVLQTAKLGLQCNNKCKKVRVMYWQRYINVCIFTFHDNYNCFTWTCLIILTRPTATTICAKENSFFCYQSVLMWFCYEGITFSNFKDWWCSECKACGARPQIVHVKLIKYEINISNTMLFFCQ